MGASGINVDNDFEPLYIVPKDKTKIIADLKEKLKKADELYLATDEDREGESISWHLIEILKPKCPVRRHGVSRNYKNCYRSGIENNP